jgi:serine/threonine protein kinase
MLVALSPHHHADLIPELAYLVNSPPAHDLVIRTLARKLSNGTPLIQGDLVLAGRDTLDAYPLAKTYPVHFRKSYYPTAFHPPATIEFERHQKISQIIDVPPPIGATRNSFRSCFIPGVPLSRISPFGLEPLEQNLAISAKIDPGHLIGLWFLLERVEREVTVLHQKGMAHGDLFLHNVIVSRSPIATCLIDFEQAIECSESTSLGEWNMREQRDQEELFRHALWVQAGLGPQPGPLGEKSRAAADRVLGGSGARCLQVIDRHSTL